MLLEVTNLIIEIFTALIAILVFLQVLLRYIFQLPLEGTEELCGFLFVWLCFLGAYSALRYNEIPKIDFINQYLNLKWQIILDIVGEVFTLIVLVFFIYGGIKATILASAQYTTAWRFSWGYVFASFPIGMSLLSLQYVILIFNNIKKLGNS